MFLKKFAQWKSHLFTVEKHCRQMAFCDTVPDAYMGDVMGDLNSKRGRILGMEPTPDHKLQVIQAQAPMSEREYGISG